MWMVHPIALIVLAMFAGVIWTKDDRRIATLGVGLVVLTVLGAGWVVHPAAALCLASFVSRGAASGVLDRDRRAIRAALGMALMAVLGAVWVLVPAAALTIATLVGRTPRPRSLARQQAKQAAFQSRPRPMAPPIPVRPGPLEMLARHPRVPADARKVAAALDQRCQATLAYLRERGVGTGSLAFEVEQIRGDFAPAALQSYLQLPPENADQAPLLDGRTGRDLLLEQLDLLHRGVEDVRARATELGGEQMIAGHRFLTQKFGERPTDLKL
ncbi:hypothetical protein G9U51_16005 [Calidifontibacter sp. DB0510]|uniref:Uncharacterized protein n=1 Tax=Metallococcus carri TaxID=1656884 RepID=A0A967B4M6_9MICO|nr:hypothetical protein [Metallococcus carri]NHN57275.1 hypothetical protein [Metallococcus carri]NOP38120.1 hypothetical protein [Calidifontibacter sp. DB2511S]